MKLPKELKEIRDLSGATSKGKKCSVKGCSELAVRSLSENKWKSYVEKADLRYNENKQSIDTAKKMGFEINKEQMKTVLRYARENNLTVPEAARRLGIKTK